MYAKKQKSLADDLPIDPNVEEYLKKAVIEEEINEGAAQISETEQVYSPESRADTPQADPSSPAKTPSPPKCRPRKTQPSRALLPPQQPASSEHTPSATGSHHIEETTTIIPTSPVPALANMLSFDMRQFLYKEEEDITSKTKSPMPDDLKTRLANIADRLKASLDTLVTNCGSIRSRFQEIQDQLPEDLIDAISPAVFLEQHKFKLERAKQRLANRLEHKAPEATIQTSHQQVNEEKSKLDELSASTEST